MTTPSILKVLIIFFTVLIANRLRVPLGVALACGGLLLDYWAKRNLFTVMLDCSDALIRPELWLLLVDISLISILGHYLSSPAISASLLGAARQLGGKRRGTLLSLIIIPAFIGMVPMPGGALFSAPLVGRGAEGHRYPPQWKAAINYWFRHVLEYWWPLYPVVIVTLSIFPITAWQFIAIQLPFTFLSITAGYFFLLRPYREMLSLQQHPSQLVGSTTIFLAFFPVALVLAATLFLPKFLGQFLPHTTPATHRLSAMLFGLLASLSLPFVQKNIGSNSIFQTLFSARTAKMVGTLAGVMFFHFLLERSSLMDLAAYEAALYPSAVFLIAGLLPFVAGFVTGIAIGFAGIAFPLVIGFITSANTTLGVFSGISLAFSMGYCGMMLSPVHLCLVLTREYFQTTYLHTIRILLPPMGAIMSAGVLLHLIFLRLGL